MQKKWFKGMAAVMAAAALAGAFAGCGGDKKAAQSGAAGQTVKFGFVTAYTGPGAAYGQAMKEGVDLAVEEINKDPKTKMKIDLVTYDTKLNKAEAINAVKKCIEQDKVLAIEGPMTSGEMFAAGPVAQQSKVVAFGTGTTAPGITDLGDYIFRNAIPGKLAIPVTVQKAYDKLGFKTVAVMYSNNNDQMVGENKIYQDVFKQLGVNVVDTETFADKDTDFSAQLTKIQAANPDVIAIAGLYQEGALIVKKAREMGMTQPIIGNNGFNSPAYIQQAGDAANGTLVATRGTRNARATRLRHSARHMLPSTDMNQISSLLRLTMLCTLCTRLLNSPAQQQTARSSVIHWLRSKTSKALPANSSLTNTAIEDGSGRSAGQRRKVGTVRLTGQELPFLK